VPNVALDPRCKKVGFVRTERVIKAAIGSLDRSGDHIVRVLGDPKRVQRVLILGAFRSIGEPPARLAEVPAHMDPHQFDQAVPVRVATSGSGAAVQ
jgi:hypothetical protein